MKHKIKIFLMVLFWGMLPLALSSADDTMEKEYQIKTALIYNFLKFIDWPESAIKPVDPESPEETAYLTVGLYIEDDDLYKLCRSIDGQSVKNRKIRVQRVGIKDLEKGKPEFWDSIDVLYLSMPPGTDEDEWVNLEKVFKGVTGRSILTISEMENFLDWGGIINFKRVGNHVKFDINLDAAKEVDLEVKTSLLKLANKVIQKKKD